MCAHTHTHTHTHTHAHTCAHTHTHTHKHTNTHSLHIMHIYVYMFSKQLHTQPYLHNCIHKLCSSRKTTTREPHTHTHKHTHTHTPPSALSTILLPTNSHILTHIKKCCL